VVIEWDKGNEWLASAWRSWHRYRTDIEQSSEIDDLDVSDQLYRTSQLFLKPGGLLPAMAFLSSSLIEHLPLLHLNKHLTYKYFVKYPSASEGHHEQRSTINGSLRSWKRA
jgi:hypothetical protein